MARRLSDADWMARFVARAGTQRAAAEQLGVSPSLIGRIVRGERNGARFREAARAGARGRRVTPPPPTSRTPRRVRQPVRTPTRGDGSRVMTKSPRLAAREMEKTVEAGRSVQGFTVYAIAQRNSDTPSRHRTGSWTGALSIAAPNDDQLAALMEGNADAVAVALREQYPWVGDLEILSITYTD